MCSANVFCAQAHSEGFIRGLGPYAVSSARVASPSAAVAAGDAALLPAAVVSGVASGAGAVPRVQARKMASMSSVYLAGLAGLL